MRSSQKLMAKITYIDSAGTARTIDAEVGSTVMETAIKNDVPGIEAECGGACACATCHVYIDPAWIAALPPRSDSEDAMLDFAVISTGDAPAMAPKADSHLVMDDIRDSIAELKHYRKTVFK